MYIKFQQKRSGSTQEKKIMARLMKPCRKAVQVYCRGWREETPNIPGKSRGLDGALKSFLGFTPLLGFYEDRW